MIKNRFDMFIKRFIQKDLSGFFIGSIVFFSLLSGYSLIGAFILPAGINSIFTSFLWKILLVIILLLAAVFSGWKFLTRKMSYSYKKNSEPFRTADFILLLIPMTPVMQYIISNQNSLTIAGSCFIFLFFLLLLALFGTVVPVLLSRFAPKRILVTASVSFLCLIMSMAAISLAIGWVKRGITPVQVAILAGLILILSLRQLIPEKAVIAAVTIFFIVNTATAVVSKNPSEGMPENIRNLPVTSVMKDKIIKKHNDILLIVYEGYTANETLKHYGYDNTDQTAFLEANGFHVYYDAYSDGTPTEQSLSKTFNLKRDITEHKKYLAGGGAVHALLKQQGYKTSGVFDNDWNFRGLPIEQIKYDLPFPHPTGMMDVKVLIRAILTGSFTDAVSFEGIDFDTYLNFKHGIIRKESGSPVFMYSHSGYPGHTQSGEGASLEQRDENIKAYLEGLQKANQEMRDDIEIIIKNNPGAIVVIAGDHGPYLTKTGYGLSKGRGNFKSKDIDRYDVQDRFGILLAVRWPEKPYEKKYDIKILQDIFPAIFSYLYEDDSLFDRLRIERETKENFRTLGVYVKDGIIYGGKDSGEPLFTKGK